MLNVDGGYLTYKLAFGGFDQWLYKYGKDVSIFAMDSSSKRKELDPNYKAQRPRDSVEKDLVYSLRDRVLEEQVLPIACIEGLEADDIVACWCLFNRDHKIIGIDKDYFQLPNLEYTYYHNFKPYSYITVLSKLPKYLLSIASRNFSLYQVLLGDVADNIPRLLAKGKEGKEQLEYLSTPMYYRRGLSKALTKLFGDKVIKNASLVLFPFCEYSNSDDWFEDWCRGNYYHLNNWAGLYNTIIGSKKPNRVVIDNKVMELFSLD